MDKLIIIGSFNKPKNGSYGGVFYACTTLANELEKHGYEIIKLDITLKNINETGIFNRLPGLITRSFKIVFSILKNRDIKNVFIFLSAGNSYFDKLPFILTSKLLRKKILLFPRSGFILRDYKKNLYKPVVNYVLKKCDHIICQSLFWKSFFQSCNVPPQKLVVIENWASETTIAQSKELDYKTYTPGELIKVVYVGRIEEAKGIIDVLQAAVILKEKKIKFHIAIFGDGAYLPQLLKSIELLELQDLVSFKGWLAKEVMQKEINEYHLALFTSKFEGYPNALLDIIFSKTPVILSDIESVKAVGGPLLNYYPPGDAGLLAEAIILTMREYPAARENAASLCKEKGMKNNISYSVEKLLKIM